MQSSDLTDMGNQCRTDNMFVGENHLCIQQHTILNTSLVVFCEEILKQTGYSLYSEDDQRKTFECELPVFGSCSVTVHDSGISGKDLIGLVIVKTKKKISEDEMMPMLEYMKQTIDTEPYYDDHGYGGCYKGLVHDITPSGMPLAAEELQEPKKDILKTIEL